MKKDRRTTKKLTKEVFIERAVGIHGKKYDYSKVVYKNLHTKVCIICPVHGEFWQYPADHLNGHGCAKCFNEEKRGKGRQLTTEDFIIRAKEIHGNKYDYSKAIYKKYNEKVCIVCPIHGEFWQTPNEHLSGSGCLRCSYEKRGNIKRGTKEAFIEKAKEIHGNKYDYSKVNYETENVKVCIICPKHGEFWQTPHSHLNGRGCPSCNTSHVEDDISSFLIENKINFILHDRKTLRNGLELDFFLPTKKIAIECQGLQHFEPVEHFGGIVGYENRLKNDVLKRKMCKDMGIKIVYFSDLEDFIFPYDVLTDKEKLKEEITHGKSI